jgi:hypothetical protein
MPPESSAFQKAIDAVEALALPDRAALLELLQKRLIEHRRQELAQDIAAVRQEVAQGDVTFGSVDDFLAELAD